MAAALAGIKALTFDVFGTVVDWRGSIIAEGRAFARNRGVELDWGAFADAWRGGYKPAMERVRRGDLPWTPIDVLHRMILEQLLGEFDLEYLSEAEKEHWNRVWHRLAPWPDSVAGLEQLRRHYVVAALSNGNIALLVNMAKNAGIPWDCVFSAELVQHYKPAPEVYLSAARWLGLEPDQVLMVAAHNDDLAGARRAGMRTAFVLRASEYGLEQKADLQADPDVDLAVGSFVELADALVGS